MNIKLTILGRSYPIAIEREQEEIYRKAEREVNATVTKLKAVYNVEAQDYLAMTDWWRLTASWAPISKTISADRSPLSVRNVSRKRGCRSR